MGAASNLEDCPSQAASSDFASSDMLKPLRDKGIHVTLDSAFQFVDCSQEFATMFTSLLKGCSFFTCISDDNQAAIRSWSKKCMQKLRLEQALSRKQQSRSIDIVMPGSSGRGPHIKAKGKLSCPSGSSSFRLDFTRTEIEGRGLLLAQAAAQSGKSVHSFS